MHAEVVQRWLVNVLAVTPVVSVSCQHHADAAMELAAIHAHTRVVGPQGALVCSAHPARGRRAAGLGQRQVAGVGGRLGTPWGGRRCLCLNRKMLQP